MFNRLILIVCFLLLSVGHASNAGAEEIRLVIEIDPYDIVKNPDVGKIEFFEGSDLNCTSFEKLDPGEITPDKTEYSQLYNPIEGKEHFFCSRVEDKNGNKSIFAVSSCLYDNNPDPTTGQGCRFVKVE